MKIWVALAVVTLLGIGAGVAISTAWSPSRAAAQSTQSQAVAAPQKGTSEAAVRTCETHMDDGGSTHIFTGYCAPDVKAQIVAADNTMKGARDFFATGSKTASAEWSSPTNAGITCGITPTDRYLIAANEIGKTRYDEPPRDDWKNLGCADSEPVRQHEILEANARRERANQAEVDNTVAQMEKEAIEHTAAHAKWWQFYQDKVVPAMTETSNDTELTTQLCGAEP
jgi:hypothetical protein